MQQVSILKHMGGCQNYGPFLGTLNIRCRIITGTQKGTIILTTTHMSPSRTDRDVAEPAEPRACSNPKPSTDTLGLVGLVCMWGK